MGAPIRGHYRGFKAGHHLTNEVLKALFSDTSAWQRVLLTETDVEISEKRDPLAAEAGQLIAVANLFPRPFVVTKEILIWPRGFIYGS